MTTKFADAVDITRFREEDLAFLEACYDLHQSTVENNPLIKMHQATFDPVYDEDDSVNEVMVNWNVNGSKLNICYAKTVSIIHAHGLEAKTKFSAFEPRKLRSTIAHLTWIAPEVSTQFIHTLNKLIECGYEARCSVGDNYPVPSMLFDKKDSPIGSVGMLEFTPYSSRKPTLN